MSQGMPARIEDLPDEFARLGAHLKTEGERLRAEYGPARPYPHLALDGLFEPAVLDRIVAEFPRPGERDWLHWQTGNEDKSTSRGLAGLSPFTQLFFFFFLSSNEWIEALEQITGIEDLLPVPLCFGAGLQECSRDGWLNVHSDYLVHPTFGLEPRLNLLIYLNRDWQPGWGGALELWDRASLTRGASYPPLFNRCVLFPTNLDSLHGHPVRLSCPPDRRRQLVSVYCWSAASREAPGGGALARASACARRAAQRAARRLRWRGPKFYDVGFRQGQGVASLRGAIASARAS